MRKNSAVNITTTSSTDIKLPEIYASPGNISKYEMRAYASIKTTLPTLCMNKGWDKDMFKTSNSDFLPENSGIGD
jgi:hypothetical protein